MRWRSWGLILPCLVLGCTIPVTVVGTGPKPGPVKSSPAGATADKPNAKIDKPVAKADRPLAKIEGVLVGRVAISPIALYGRDYNQLFSDNGSGLIGQDGGSLIGQGGSTLIGQDGSSLIGQDGASAVAPYAVLDAARAFRILLAAGTAPLGADVLVTLVNSEGKSVTSEVVRTDAHGEFSFKSMPTTGEAYFVQADLTNERGAFVFRAMVTPVAAGQRIETEIDEASTVVAAKGLDLLRRGALGTAGIATGSLAELAQKFREHLRPALIPFMGRDSRDILPLFDQFVQDFADFGKGTQALLPEAVAPSGDVTVTSMLDPEGLRTLGIIPSYHPAIMPDGFEADAAGTLYFPIYEKAKSASFIRTLDPNGVVGTFGTVPLGPPLYMAMAGDGRVFLAGHDDALDAMVVYAGTRDNLIRMPGILYKALATTTSACVERDLRQQVQDFDLGGRIAVDAQGAVYASFRNFNIVVRLAPGAGQAEVVAGSLEAGYQDGQGTAARFNGPASLALGPDGAIYVADSKNMCIRRIGTDGAVTTVAGKPGEDTYRNGRGLFARFGTPESLVIDGEGNFYVADSTSKRVRRISPNGSVFLVAGTGEPGQLDGAGTKARFGRPNFLARDGKGNLYLLDTQPRGGPPLGGPALCGSPPVGPGGPGPGGPGLGGPGRGGPGPGGPGPGGPGPGGAQPADPPFVQILRRISPVSPSGIKEEQRP